MQRHRRSTLAAALFLTLGAVACGSDDGADVRNIGEEDGTGSGTDSSSSSGSSSATETGG